MAIWLGCLAGGTEILPAKIKQIEICHDLCLSYLRYALLLFYVLQWVLCNHLKNRYGSQHK